ncbi:glycosyltransferase [Candidatus Saccharibacteria bacterium]|nr:glycosyltransferase [Candidatus Saccharibacteria bacterium]
MALLLILYVIIYWRAIYSFEEKIVPKSGESRENLHTFVVLAYKESEFLESCIESVKNQTLPTNVVIFTTTLNEHITRLAKKYNLDIKTGEHTSIGGDFDSALAAANTPLVTIAHQDDIYDPSYAEKIIDAYLEAGNETQIIFSDYYELRGKKKVFSNTNLRIKRILLTPLNNRSFYGQKWAKRFALRFGDAISCPAVTFNTKKVKPPLFKCDMSCNVDWQAWEKLSRRKGKFVFVKEPLMGHRIHVDSETSKTLADDRRSAEDFAVYRKFWPDWIARKLTKTYKASEKSNNL